MKEYFEVKLENRIIKGDLRYNKGSKMPLIFFLHGFKSFRNWGFIPFICDKLSDKGYNVINFDYSQNGIIDEEKQLFDPIVFANQTVTSHYLDYIVLNQFIQHERKLNNMNLDDLWDGRIYNIGHSMGGALSYIASGEVKIDKIVSLASISRLDRNTERQKKVWEEKGYTDIRIKGSDQVLHLNYSYLKDKDNNYPDDIILKAIYKYNGKYLVVHPKNDIVAKLEEAYELFEAGSIKDNKELFVIDGTGHTFSVGHPFTGENKYLRLLINKLIEFFDKE